MKTRPVWVIGTLVFLVCSSVTAFGGPPKVQVFNEVEKGFEIGGQFGAAWDIKPPVDSPGLGALVGLELGYDLSWVFRLRAGFTNHLYSAMSEDHRGEEVKMNFEQRVAWLGLQFAPLATQRFFTWLQAGAGYMFTSPKDVDGINIGGKDDAVILAGGGLEYYTTLRHFSIGIEANAMYIPHRGDFAITLAPVVRYTFGVGESKVIKPPEDRDHDGIPDKDDKCPDTWGVEAQQGCPEPDTDGDGVPDREDRCPEEPGPVENNGCPENRDQDGDGLPDKLDKCPTERGPQANEGCPEEDADEDGVPDRIDLCPKRPGKKEFDGCPKKSDVKIRIKREAIELREKIHFETDKAIIKSKSFELLDQVVHTLKSHPEIQKLSIEGHTDSVGKSSYNQDLSQRRAQAVVDYLVNKGVEPGRLEAKGFGEKRPIASNKTPKGRAQNRRVEMLILERGD